MNVSRVEWQCPRCGKRYAIPAGTQPDVCPACAQAAGATPPSAPPPGYPQSAATGDSAQFQFDQMAPSGGHADFRHRRRSGMDHVWWLLDLRFERYLTPWIVRFTWHAALILGLGAICLWTIGSLADLLSSPRPTSPTGGEGGFQFAPDFLLEVLDTRLARHFVAWCVQVLIIAFGLLYVRVICEAVIVLFHVSNTLADIRRQLGEAIQTFGRKG